LKMQKGWRSEIQQQELRAQLVCKTLHHPFDDRLDNVMC